MTLPVILSDAAQREYDEAYDWYEAQDPGRGDQFSACVLRTLDRIVEQPQLHPTIYHDARAKPVEGFRYYRVIYRIMPTRIVVISIFHTSSHPRIWQRRL